MLTHETLQFVMDACTVIAIVAILLMSYLAFGRGGSTQALAGTFRRHVNATALGLGVILAVGFVISRVFINGPGLAYTVDTASFSPDTRQFAAFLTEVRAMAGTGLDRALARLGLSIAPSELLAGSMIAACAIFVRDIAQVWESRDNARTPPLWSLAAAEVLSFLAVGPLLILGLGPLYSLMALTCLGLAGVFAATRVVGFD